MNIQDITKISQFERISNIKYQECVHTRAEEGAIMTDVLANLVAVSAWTGRQGKK